MIKSQIYFQNIPSVPQLIKDFINQEIAGFEMQKFSIKNALKQAEIKQKYFTKEQRNTLTKSLKTQLSTFNLSEKQKENIEFLANENTFTIVTGHQLNLFSGPVFFIYKILQTIKTAEILNQNSQEKRFVPVFWLATEDHDFEEINHFKTEKKFYQISAKSGGAVGRITLRENHFIEDFEKEFKDDIFGTELILMLKEAYKIGRTLSQATKILVNRLFADFGLLMIDGDDFALKTQMKSIFEDELQNHSLKNSTKKTVDFLTEKYGKVQVNPREINLFYLSDTRNRIDFDGENYQIVDKNITFNQEEIVDELQNFPEKFSPNALLRPIYQEKTLPNVAYIGGNAEIMYWLELKDYFAKLQIPFPLLVPRNSMLFLSPKIFHKIEKSGLKMEDFMGNFREILNQNLLENHKLIQVIHQNKSQLEKTFLALREKSYLTDKSFENLVKAEETRQMKSFERMEKRLLKAERRKQAEKVERLENLFSSIHPRNIWQERVYNFSVFFAENGANWLENCYEKIDVENSSLIILEL